jgi:diguanylate cyclase (GGDEF)-like protein
MKEAALVLAGIFAGLTALGGMFIYCIIGTAICLVIFMANRSTKAPITTQTQIVQQIVKQTLEEDATPFDGVPNTNANKGMQYKFKRKFMAEMEAELDSKLYEGLHMLRKMIPTAHSVSLFFPGPRPDTLVLRLFDSASDQVLPNAEISKGQGLLGRLLKLDSEKIIEGGLENSRSLFYYKDLIDVKSVIAVPLYVEGHFNGAIAVDSLEPGAFGPDQIEELNSFGQLVGYLAYKYYLDFEHHYQKEQFSSLLDYQKRFLKNLSEKEIHKHLLDFIDANLHYDRMMILERDPNKANSAKVVHANGLHAEMFLGREMEIDGKGFLSLCFLNNVPLNRTMKPGEYLARISADEYRSENLKSITAIPISTQGTTIDMVISIESTSKMSYSKHHIDLLMSIGSLAGFAISRARVFQQKEEMATRDGLTGLYNHRTFQERYAEEVKRSRRSKSPLGVLITDIDHFKKVNDTHGHPIGDLAIKLIANLMNSQIREGVDLLARYGGEEFVVLMPETDAEGAAEMAERIRLSIEANPLRLPDGSFLNLTTSIGIAVFPEDSEEPKRVLELSDKSLYSAKHSGRNQVVCWKNLQS